jgi:hypothetical protein
VPTAPPSPPLQPPTMPVLVVAQLLGALSLAAGDTTRALLAKVLAGSAESPGCRCRCSCCWQYHPATVKAIPD